MNLPNLRSCGLAITTLLLSACTTVGPDFQQQHDSVVLPTQWEQEQVRVDSQATAMWWQQFNDSTLNTLITRASQQNLDVEAAGLRILQARSVLGIADGLRYPQAQVASGNLAFAYQNDQSFTNAALTFDAGWEMDVWGKYARGIESAQASYYASVASYNDILVTITSEVARNYINFRTFQERILLSQRNIEIQQRVVNITRVQFESGNVTELDVQQAQNQLFTTMAALPSLKIAMQQAKNALAVLLGTLPEQIEPLLHNQGEDIINKGEQQFQSTGKKLSARESDALSMVPKAPSLEPSIEASLVLRRPDLQVAELQAHAQSAQIGITEAALYPSFSLFGSIGINSTTPTGSSLSLSDSLMLVAGPTFSWNIFQYGRIKNNVRFEDARFQETLTNYNKKVLQAVQEVTNALDAYQLYQEQQGLRLRSVDASIRAFNISMTQYENGQISFERLLSSLEKMTRSEDSYAQIKGNVANQVVALYKSLGGGWQVNSGKAFISDDLIETMNQRSDWGDTLSKESVLLPSNTQSVESVNNTIATDNAEAPSAAKEKPPQPSATKPKEQP
ncbi:TolC family protein [Vibrio methylphosphonaticus]|uniref:TolC family protein n=1 Tax=Vibrio methylphosphonaticus TaxID=2946866 RepID=UPI002029B873|nr:TolC family protein [Vibrio methylphosphonaticus]MCL9774787.1 TolC family protein [Vibrio methylphosphonaticus]